MTTTEPAIVVNGTMYVVVDSQVNGGIVWKTVVGPNGGVFTLASFKSGRVELLNKNMRTIWSSK